jgi:hypothetical protein
VFLIMLLALTGLADGETRLEIESRDGRAGPVNWQSASLVYLPGGAPESGGDSQWRLRVEGLAWRDWRGSVAIDCAVGGLRAGRPWCHQGKFEWLGADGSGRLAGRLLQPEGASDLAFVLESGSLTGSISWPDPSGSALPGARVSLQGFDLTSLPGSLARAMGLSVLEGRLDGQIEVRSGRLSFDLALADGAFDRPDGLVAGAGLAVSLRGELENLDDIGALDFSAALSQRAGEVLAGPVYLPSPERPLELELSGSVADGRRIQVDSLALDDGGLVEANGGFTLAMGEGGWRLAELIVERARLEFPGAWRRWGDGLASSRGFGDLETDGEVSAALAWRSGDLQSVRVDFEGVDVRDAAGRAAIDSLEGTFERSKDDLRADLTWEALELFSLAFGNSRLAAAGEPSAWGLVEPLRLPLLDGAFVVERLAVQGGDSGQRSLTLDAHIAPLELSALTEMLGLPTFSGQLSGRFPGVQVSGDRIAFSGGIDIRAFSGGIRLGDLVIERPFGSLPALAAQVEFERLDLAELTGAFNFGHMEGEVSGWMRDLRLLDWRPVAMDARLYTHEDVPSRRISQRAVENLSRLGGGAAALGATVLRMFDEFPYRRAGLACRLDRNICHIDGVAPHESGGFYILEGRGLPHLDVVGHRRLVDWPRLVAQLVAMTKT